MKKTVIILSVAIALTFSGACSKINSETDFAPVFRGTIAPATRTTLHKTGNSYEMLWSQGDRITVSNGTQTAEYQATEGGSATVAFEPVSGEPFAGTAFTACYPASLFDGQLPARQLYVENDIADYPMFAESGADPTHLIFRPACSILKIDVFTSQGGVSLAAIQVSADQPLSGTFVLTNGTLGVTEGGGVSLDCGDGVAINATPKPFHVHLPAGVYTNLKIRLIATDGKEFVSVLPDGEKLSFLRGELRELTLAADAFSNPTSEGKAVLRTGTDVNEMMKRFSNASAKAANTNSTIRRIVFKVNDPTRSDVLVSDFGSEPIYLTWDSGTGTVTFTTRADEIHTNPVSSYFFCWLNALEEIEGLEHLNTSDTKYFDRMFIALKSANVPLTTLDLSHFDTHNAISMVSMFDSLVNLQSVRVESFNTSNVRSFASMFGYCTSLTDVDVSGFVTSSAVNMSGMFRWCESLTELDLHSWDLSKVKNLSYAFQYCSALQRLDLGGADCKSTALTDASWFINASNNLKDLRFGKAFLCESMASLSAGFYQGTGYLKATVENPLVIRCAPAFAQKSLRSSASALYYTNQRCIVWKDIETDENIRFNQEIGYLTSIVSVQGAQVFFDVDAEHPFADAVAWANAYEGEGEPVIRLMADVAYNSAVSLGTASSKPVTLDLNGHVLSTTASPFLSTAGVMNIMDSSPVKGKITGTGSKIVNVITANTTTNIDGCVIECTKAAGADFQTDPVLHFNYNASTTVANITNAKVYSTAKVTVLYAPYATVTVTNSELTSGKDGNGWYVMIANYYGIITVNSGSFYTSGTGYASTLHCGSSNASVTVNGGWFHSGGRAISGYNAACGAKVTLNAAYLNMGLTHNVSPAAGKSLVTLSPAVTHTHETTGATLSYGYQVK